MISFIIIGKNVENTISLCLNSVFKFIDINKITDFEVIYVDSFSTDNSISIAEKYPIKIYHISGKPNAAIGRNIGARYSMGDILFFIDGDMEIIPDFYPLIFCNHKLIYPFINGYLTHKIYDEEYQHLETKDEEIPSHLVFRDVTGGLMIVKKECWLKLNGMDERLIRNQDLDFGFRMSGIGIRAMVFNARFAIHHTCEYYNKVRYQGFIFSKALYSTGILMRKHLLKFSYIKRQYQQVLLSFMIFLSILFFFLKPLIGLLLLIIYSLFQIGRVLKNKRKGSFFSRFIFNFLFSFYSLIGCLFYYPKSPDYIVEEHIRSMKES
jgi:glycosyltransferase involved in cell wall biosynthesis